jgi:hypothetical protein
MSKQKIVDSVKFANKAFETIEKREAYVKELEDKIEHLENLLKNSTTTEPLSSLARKPHEEEIIQVEMKRMHDRIVLGQESLTRDDLKKFEILVKCLVAIKNGELKDVKKKGKEKEQSVEELLRLVGTDFSDSDQE